MESLQIFRPRSLTERFSDLSSLVSASAATAGRFSRRLAISLSSGPALSRADVRRARLRVMFAGGGLGGLLASRFVNPGRQRAFHLLFHDLLAFWSNNIIAWDEAMDSKQLDREASLELLRRSLLTIFGAKSRVVRQDIPEAACEAFKEYFGIPIEPPADSLFYPATADFRFENYALSCGIRMGRTIEALKRIYATAGVDQRLIDDNWAAFERRCVALHHAQLTSLEQRQVDEQHQWPWYRDRLLDQKFNNILYAPLQLFIPLRHPAERREEIRQGLLLISTLFFHRQAIDDILDIASDAEEGLVGAPGYILCSQGSLARDLAPSFPLGAPARLEGTREKILRRIQESRMLDIQFSAWTQLLDTREWEVDRIEECSTSSLSDSDLELLLRRALSNDEDLGADGVDTLAARAVELHRRYCSAMDQNDSAGALNALLKSRAAHRILDTVEDRTHQAGIVQQLGRLDQPQLRPILDLYYRRCLNSYNASRRNLHRLEQDLAL